MNKISSTLGDVYMASLSDGFEKLLQQHQPGSIFIIGDSNTVHFCAPKVSDLIQCTVVPIPAGEINKNLISCEWIWSKLIESGADRKSIVLNVGGGMVCDIGGFAASCFQRGIRYANIPTSLLAMTDAALGGKNGIDFNGLKNYLGFFNKPLFIWIDTIFLNTLPKHEMVSGKAEMVKHAIIGSRKLWDILEKTGPPHSLNLEDALNESIRVKLGITESDFFEANERKKLNFGHTIGHALESHFLNTDLPLTHGQAITLGMMAESFMANRSGILNNTEFNAIVKMIEGLLEPVRIPLPNFSDLKSLMKGDKKSSFGVTQFSLPDKIGSCRWDIPVEEKIVEESLIWLSTQVVDTLER